MVNTRRVDKSWSKAAKLVHLDRTPCLDECIANDHYGKNTDTGTTLPDLSQELQTKSDDIIQGKGVSTQLSVPTTVQETVNAGSSSTTDGVMPANTEENVNDGTTLPDLGSKHTDAEPNLTATIDLPLDIADEVTLPKVDIEQDELATDFLDNELDNAALVGINAAPMTDFTREMAQEEGVDRDLELELENLAFLKENRSKHDKDSKKDKNEDNQRWDGKPRKEVNKSSVTPHNTRRPKPVRNSATLATMSNPSTPGSPKGVWKTMKHGIRKKYGPSHPQSYGCKVCGQLLSSRGELNEHYRCNHPPVLCPVCKKSLSCPNT